MLVPAASALLSLLIMAQSSAPLQKPVKVEVRLADSSYQLMRVGKPYFIKGAGENFVQPGNSKGIPHEFRIRYGSHTWTYWRESFLEVARFVSQSFYQF